ncbi:cobalamin biosynthesis protein [Rhodobacterales bacterium HKCCE3408]|nr:cobalamin biosynthesis protein [Rhodobacterales bacterium HKCCE3408]
MTAAILLAALVLDAALGEPRWLWSRLPHPAVLMGRAIAWGEARLNGGTARRLKGALLVLVLVALGWTVGALISALPLSPLWQALAAAILLAQRSLSDHVGVVATGLRDGLPAGRSAVSMIVGRDTAAMDEPAVARAAIESAAENLSDGVIAPAFWFLVAGLPGMIVYKIVNTADSMIGHRTERYAAFGWAAAKADDLLNWIPARLSALLITLAYGNPMAWDAALEEGPRHRSPNAGWPEAALARALGIALSGPRSYAGRIEDQPFVNPAGRHDIGATEIDAARAGLWRVWAVGILLLAIGVVAG